MTTAALEQDVLVDSGCVQVDAVTHLSGREVRPAGGWVVPFVDVDSGAVRVGDAEIQTLLDVLRMHIGPRSRRTSVLVYLPFGLAAICQRQTVLRSAVVLRCNYVKSSQLQTAEFGGVQTVLTL